MFAFALHWHWYCICIRISFALALALALYEADFGVTKNQILGPVSDLLSYQVTYWTPKVRYWAQYVTLGITKKDTGPRSWLLGLRKVRYWAQYLTFRATRWHTWHQRSDTGPSIWLLGLPKKILGPETDLWGDQKSDTGPDFWGYQKSDTGPSIWPLGPPGDLSWHSLCISIGIAFAFACNPMAVGLHFQQYFSPKDLEIVFL